MPKQTTRVLWITDEPQEYWEEMAEKARQAGIDLWIFNDATIGERQLKSHGCRRPNGFRAVVFDLTIENANKFCQTVRRRHPGLPRVCFTPHVKDARRQVPTFEGQTSTRPTLILTWYQGNMWTVRPHRLPAEVGRSDQLTHILRDVVGI